MRIDIGYKGDDLHVDRPLTQTSLTTVNPKTSSNLTMEEMLETIRQFNAETEIVWHEEAQQAMRDLAVRVKIPLSIIADAAAKKPRWSDATTDLFICQQSLRYSDVPLEVIEEYKRWRRVYEATRRLKQS